MAHLVHGSNNFSGVSQKMVNTGTENGILGTRLFSRFGSSSFEGLISFPLRSNGAKPTRTPLYVFISRDIADTIVSFDRKRCTGAKNCILLVVSLRLKELISFAMPSIGGKSAGTPFYGLFCDELRTRFQSVLFDRKRYITAWFFAA